MTSEELRALDREVAVKVMGFTAESVELDRYCEMGSVNDCSDPARREVPAYSSDIAAAWSVFEKFATNGAPLGSLTRWRRAIEQDQSGKWFAGIIWLSGVDEPITQPRWEFVGSGETESLAICRAALKMVNAKA